MTDVAVRPEPDDDGADHRADVGPREQPRGPADVRQPFVCPRRRPGWCCDLCHRSTRAARRPPAVSLSQRVPSVASFAICFAFEALMIPGPVRTGEPFPTVFRFVT